MEHPKSKSSPNLGLGTDESCLCALAQFHNLLVLPGVFGDDEVSAGVDAPLPRLLPRGRLVY